MMYEIKDGWVEGNATGFLGSPVCVAIAAIGVERPGPLPESPVDLLDEASELLQAAKTLQDRAHRSPEHHEFDADYVASAVVSLTHQSRRLASILECDLFESIYAELIAAINAGGIVESVKRQGLKTVIATWKDHIPQMDYWRALVWVSREWKRRKHGLPKPSPGELELIGRIADLTDADIKVTKTRLENDAHINTDLSRRLPRCIDAGWIEPGGKGRGSSGYTVTASGREHLK